MACIACSSLVALFGTLPSLFACFTATSVSLFTSASQVAGLCHHRHWCAGRQGPFLAGWGGWLNRASQLRHKSAPQAVVWMPLCSVASQPTWTNRFEAALLYFLPAVYSKDVNDQEWSLTIGQGTAAERTITVPFSCECDRRPEPENGCNHRTLPAMVQPAVCRPWTAHSCPLSAWASVRWSLWQ